MNRVMLIDIDGTVCCDIKNEESHLYPTAEPIEGAKEIINGWYDTGHTICFFTARENKDRKVTEDWLKTNGFKYHSLMMDKPRCRDGQEYFWIDNRPTRAVTYKGVWSELVKTTRQILTFKD